MRRPDLKAMRLWIGEGENHFTMSRGSFRYKQKIRNKRELRREGIEETPQGFQLRFSDPKTGEEHFLTVTAREDGLREVRYEGSLSEVGSDADGQKDQTGPAPRFWIGLPVSPTEHIYGCGETYSKFDLKGEKVRIWVAEHQNAGRITGKILRQKVFGKKPDRTLPFGRYESYYAQPTFVSSERYFVHTDAERYSEMDFSDPSETILYFQESPSFLYGEGETFTEISGKLTAVLGRQEALPDWIYDGAILAIQGGTEVLREKVRKMKEAGTKVCGIWSQDWCGCRRTGFGYQVMWNWEWDKELYPGLDEAIREWKKEGIRFLGYINPFIALEKDLYRVASEKGYCVKDKEGKDYQVTITTFPAAMVDFTNPEAYEWYKGLIKENMIGLGMGGCIPGKMQRPFTTAGLPSGRR
jgi:alpha-glucosidase